MMANNNTLRKAGAALPLLMLSALAGAQNFTASGALSTADGIISGIKDITFHVAAGIIALAAVVLLVWQELKRLAGPLVLSVHQQAEEVQHLVHSLLAVSELRTVISFRHMDERRQPYRLRHVSSLLPG